MDLWNNESEASLWITIPEWIEQDITPSTIAAVVQGGCESGAYMPAVTYHTANQTMSEHGDAVLDYLNETLGELPAVPQDVSWSGLAVHFLSTAVFLWCSTAEHELMYCDDTITPDSELFLNDAHGVYIPKLFAEQVRRELVTGVTDEDWKTLESGPDGEWYWDCWNDVLNNAEIDDGTRRWTLHQDGDLWIVPTR